MRSSGSRRNNGPSMAPSCNNRWSSAWGYGELLDRNYLGIHIFLERFPSLVKKEYIDRTYGFYEKYGGAAIFVARFVPIVRTFAPFLAGVGSMNYRRFLFYNVLGGCAWTFVVVLGGYYFGTLPIVRENMSILIFLVILVTVGTILLVAAGLVSAHLKKRKAYHTKKGR